MSDSRFEPGAPPPADDLLTGISAIADFLGWPERRVAYQLERKRLPAGKCGKHWVASKTRLARRFAKLTAGEGA